MIGKSALMVQKVLQGALDFGVRTFVVCAGARNSHFVLTLGQRLPGVDVFHFFEERSASFFALGKALSTQRPVAVITTSGTAVSECFSAVIEAHYQGIPLVFITADRPASFRGSGAPQSIEQVGIFGDYVSGSLDVQTTANATYAFNEWLGKRPFHINVCLEEPTPLDKLPELIMPQGLPSAFEVRESYEALEQFMMRNEGSLLVMLGALKAGDRTAVCGALVRLGAPVWCEATSGLRGHPDLGHLEILGGDDSLTEFVNVERVLKVGGVPSVRFWRDMEKRPDVKIFSLSNVPFSGLARDCESLQVDSIANAMSSIEVSVPSPELDSTVAQRVEQLTTYFWESEPGWFRALSMSIPEDACVFLGNSMPIREWNLAAAPIPRLAFANRGTNGIDGALSTFLGIDVEAGEIWGIFGDLTTLYDLVAPYVMSQLSGPPRRLVVINNAGGRIFERLPCYQHLGDRASELVMNPHALDFKHWARMWNLPYRCVTHSNGLGDLPDVPLMVIEIRPNAAQTEAFWSAMHQH